MRQCRENQVVYSLQDMDEVYPIPSLNLPDLIEEKCYKPKDGSPYRVFLCSGGTQYNRVCDACGSIKVHIHGKMPERRLIHDINVGINKVDILLAADRYRCEDCGHTFNRLYDGIEDNRQMTSRLLELIKRNSFRTTFTDVANDTGYSDVTVAHIFDDYAAELEAERGQIIAPRVLGIDEKHIVNKMRAVFVDIESGELIEMKEDNKRDTIISTIRGMAGYENIRMVTMDMACGYKSFVQECLPQAKIIVDKFHVIQDLYRKIVKTRSTILNALQTQIDAETDPERKAHLRDVRNLAIDNNFLFKFGREKLAEKQTRLAAMADLIDTFPEFRMLYLLKEGFELIYDQRTRKDAEYQYRLWTDYVPPTGKNQIALWEKEYGVKAELFSEFRTFRNAMRSWYNEVFNYFDPGCQFTNAASEGLNRQIEFYNRLGNGYSFARLRARALFYNTAAPMVTYFINKKEVPVYADGKVSDAASGSVNYLTFKPGEIFGHKTEYSIECEEHLAETLDRETVYSFMQGTPEDL